MTDNPFAGLPCAECGQKTLRLTWRLTAKPLGTHSLSGSTMKVSAYNWPWCVCDNCGRKSKGKR